MLRLLPKQCGVGVREDLDTVVPIDGSALSARIARQARVPQRMDIAGAHALAHLEPGCHVYVSARQESPSPGTPEPVGL